MNQNALDDAHRMYNTNIKIKFKPGMLKPRLCNYSDGHILQNGAITVAGQETDAAAIRVDRSNKQVVFKTFPHFVD